MEHPTALRRSCSILVIALCCSVLVACSDDETEPPDREDRGELTVYSSLPLQGDSKPQSEDVVLAIEMALADHDGRAGGFDITHVPLDDADPELGMWDAGRVVANAERAANDPSTIAYVGEFNSGATAASMPILNEAGILQVSPASTYVGLTRSDGAEEGEPHIYYPTGTRHYGRVVPADHVQAGALVAAMRERGCQDVFIVHDGDTYGRGIADAVESGAEDAGLPVLGNLHVSEAESAVEAARPDCFFLGGITQNGAPDVANDVAADLPGTQMFFPDGCAELAFTEALDPGVAENVFITNPTLSPESYPEAGQEFYAAFEEAHGRQPEPFAIYGYEAMSVVLDSIERAGAAADATSEGRAAVVAAFFDTAERESVLGTYDIDDYGDTTLAGYGGYTVDGDRLVFDSVIEPVVVAPASGPELTPVPTEEPEASPLEGRWLGGEVTLVDLRRLRSDKEANFVFEANRARESLVTRLDLRGDHWQTLVSIDGGDFEGAQAGTYSVDGDRVHMVDEQGANYTYGFELDGDELRIRLLESDAGMAAPGISDDAFQAAHYAEPFQRVD